MDKTIKVEGIIVISYGYVDHDRGLCKYIIFQNDSSGFVLPGSGVEIYYNPIEKILFDWYRIDDIDISSGELQPLSSYGKKTQEVFIKFYNQCNVV